jgi:hypothetical protein
VCLVLPVSLFVVLQQRETLATLDTQDTGGRQTKHKYNKERYW